MAIWPRAFSRACAIASISAPFVATGALAHGDHGGGGGTVLPAGTTLVTFDVDYVKYKPISDARLTDLATNGVEEVHSLKSIAVPSVSLAYGVTNDLTIGVRLPYLGGATMRSTRAGNRLRPSISREVAPGMGWLGLPCQSRSAAMGCRPTRCMPGLATATGRPIWATGSVMASAFHTGS